MSDHQIYQNFISWLGKTWWGLPESDQLMKDRKASVKLLRKTP